jgi:fatty acid desaturase
VRIIIDERGTAPRNADRRSTVRQLAWFGALWASGVLSLACVAGLLRWILSGLLLGPTTAQGTGPAAKPGTR